MSWSDFFLSLNFKEHTNWISRLPWVHDRSILSLWQFIISSQFLFHWTSSADLPSLLNFLLHCVSCLWGAQLIRMIFSAECLGSKDIFVVSIIQSPHPQMMMDSAASPSLSDQLATPWMQNHIHGKSIILLYSVLILSLPLNPSNSTSLILDNITHVNNQPLLTIVFCLSLK